MRALACPPRFPGVAAAAFPRDTAPNATPVAVAPMNRLRPIRETLVSVAR
jgi:hypothetical protein